MSANANNELLQIRQELQKIIDELDTISNGVRKDFEGIGNNICADSIKAAADNYRSLKKKLNNIEIEPEKPASSGGSSGSGSSGSGSSGSGSSGSGSSGNGSSGNGGSSSKEKNSIWDFLEGLFG